MAITEWADVLRRSPIFPYGVQEHNDWKNNRPAGSIANLEFLVWHHDGSPVGPSPGDVGWLITEYNAKRPSAQIIIGYDGTWHFCGSGYASHAGVTDGVVTNSNSAGTETDQTTGESPSPALLDSVRRGYAAIFQHEGWPATRMRFHKKIARPVGRKPDPDFGTAGSNWNPDVWDVEYAREVKIIQSYIDGADIPPDAKDWFEMATEADLERIVTKVVQKETAEIYRMVGVLTGAFQPDTPGAVKTAAEKSIGEQVRRANIDAEGHQLGQTIVDISNRTDRIEKALDAPKA